LVEAEEKPAFIVVFPIKVKLNPITLHMHFERTTFPFMMFLVIL